MHTKYQIPDTKYVSLVLLITGYWLLVAFFAPWAQAQGTAGLSLQPALFEERANPGDEFSKVIRARNLAPAAKTFYVRLRNIKDVTESGQPVFAADDELTPYDLAGWISVSSEPIVIAAGAEAEVPFTIRVPNDAVGGGRFAGIFLSDRPVRPGETGVGVGYEVGSIISLRIAGSVIEEARIREFRTEKGVYGAANAKIFIRVENLGNVLVRPIGIIDITDMLGNTAQLRVNAGRATIFPGTVREFELAWEGPWYAIGRHQALVALAYGDDERRTISGVLTFWVLPMRIIGPLLAGLAGIIVFLWVIVRLHIRRRLRQMTANVSGVARQEVLVAEQKTASRGLAATVLALAVLTAIFLVILFFFLA
ncbi:MAG: hypothetical protein Q8Q39_05400 [bacterium]|nr:hypothetical protein [bacterium]